MTTVTRRNMLTSAASLPALAAVPSDRAAVMTDRIRAIVEQIDDLETSLVTTGSAAYLIFMADVLERCVLGGEPLPDVPDELGALELAYPFFRQHREECGDLSYGLPECWRRRGLMPPAAYPKPWSTTRLRDRRRL